MNNQAGKGDSYRKVDYSKWSENYDRIFRKDSRLTAKRISKNHVKSEKSGKN